VKFEYIIRIEPKGEECLFSRSHELREREVIQSALGAVVVDEIETQPAIGVPGRAKARPFTPIHHAGESA
jgi:hypothetical protein